MSAIHRRELLRKSWTQIAEQYERHLVPRFMPWTQHTLQCFLVQKFPPGSILVPACGPGHELVMLAESFPDDRQIIGLDLAEGMVDLANARCAEAGISGRARAEVGDACDLGAKFSDVAGVFSLFGLQQLPQAHLALANWVNSLTPGGSLAVTFWPSQVEQEGPWQRLAALSTNKPKAQLNTITQASAQKVSWEQHVPAAALMQGGTLLADDQPAFAMHWANIEQFWQVMTEAGPWHARLLQLGADHMASLKEEFMAGYPSPKHGPIEHFPRARLILIQKTVSAL